MTWIKETLQKFEGIKVLIIGDVMIDRYLTGYVSRISPEAPVPIVNLEEIDNRLGGAANVALNIKALGGVPLLCSIVGKDDNGAIFRKILLENGIDNQFIFQSDDRKTTVKSRVVSHNQQMLRLDYEDTHDLLPDEEFKFKQFLEEIIDRHKPQIILLQDYNKGVLTSSLIEWIINKAQGLSIPVSVDPKKRNFLAYKGVNLFKPNLKEVKEALSIELSPVAEELQNASDKIRLKLNNQITLITLSEHGVFIDDDKDHKIFPTHPRNVSDVCGAGDTVISIVSLGLAAGLSSKELATLANFSGGQVCEKPGVVPVNKYQLIEELANFDQLH